MGNLKILLVVQFVRILIGVSSLQNALEVFCNVVLSEVVIVNMNSVDSSLAFNRTIGGAIADNFEPLLIVLAQVIRQGSQLLLISAQLASYSQEGIRRNASRRISFYIAICISSKAISLEYESEGIAVLLVFSREVQTVELSCYVDDTVLSVENLYVENLTIKLLTVAISTSLQTVATNQADVLLDRLRNQASCEFRRLNDVLQVVNEVQSIAVTADVVVNGNNGTRCILISGQEGYALHLTEESLNSLERLLKRSHCACKLPSGGAAIAI